jgi:phosphoglycolate phosphatase-like HAD superfamily hydrolase
LSSGDGYLQNIAIAWIRDGVLIDRMPENAAAFAVASLQHIYPENRKRISIEELIGWAFEQSGVSAEEKMIRFNEQRGGTLINVAAAEPYYSALSAAVEASLEYFDGAVELLRDLHEHGASHYITSAIRQETLDEWARGTQGREVSGYLREILGKRQDFAKGRSHFSHIRGHGAPRIYYVADAIREIIAGRECGDLGVIPVGFSSYTSEERLMRAFENVMRAEAAAGMVPLYRMNLKIPEISRVIIPPVSELSNALAGNALVVGTRGTIMGRLREYFVQQGVL